MDSEELQSILAEQSRELAAAKVTESDLDLRLQMQEALTASSQSPSSSKQFQLHEPTGERIHTVDDWNCVHIMSHCKEESSITASDKIYCPYPRCSALMSKAEVLVKAHSGGSSKCKICHGLFCVNCKVPWHNDMSCHAYKSSNPYPCAEDTKLKSLATKNLWRQCVKCNHKVELAAGCNHIYCR
ncbi:zinc finger (C3HC4-type RING finger) family protein [Actinidia rufa]|uniref:RBR-type E3 ubiquitin transferase n=1 Tax=Actinidia rufa TaxID=165716 RepID=A0A7J0HCN8_9ERIC|nr:zinc finger (C3HC4-type RING finger) family protein [Actinidia rufa]